jgi:hypothetical protein
MTERPDADGVSASDQERSTVGDLVARVTASGDADGSAQTRRERAADLGRLTAALATSARTAGRASVLGGSWLADLVLDVAPRLPFRDGPTLRAQHPGLSDDDLAQVIISGAAKSSAAIGAGGGALAAVEFAAPPLLLTAPVQLAAETLIVATVEIKLIAELHEVYGVPATGPLRGRALAYVVAWSERRGIDPLSPSLLTFSMGASAKRALRNRLIRRAGRNLTTLGPLMSGAIAGSMVNHRETRRLGEEIRDDLRRRGRTIRGETVSR